MGPGRPRAQPAHHFPCRPYISLFLSSLSLPRPSFSPSPSSFLTFSLPRFLSPREADNARQPSLHSCGALRRQVTTKVTSLGGSSVRESSLPGPRLRSQLGTAGTWGAPSPHIVMGREGGCKTVSRRVNKQDLKIGEGEEGWPGDVYMEALRKHSLRRNVPR